MTEQTIVSYDPGLVTGVAVGVFSDDKPLEIIGATVMPYEDLILAYGSIRSVPFDHVVSEVFKLRTDNPFAADLTGVRVEGILESAYEGNVHWRDRTLKSQVPDEVLKENNVWFTGADVDWEDGRDANDAVIHMIGYVAFELKHKPTLRKYLKPDHGTVQLRGNN
jgi:hypothetical protein